MFIIEVTLDRIIFRHRTRWPEPTSYTAKTFKYLCLVYFMHTQKALNKVKTNKQTKKHRDHHHVVKM